MAKKPVKTPAGKTPGKAPGVFNLQSALGDMEKDWSESRVKPPRQGNFDVPDIPDGDYLVRVETAKVSAWKSGKRKGVPYFRIGYVIAVGDYTGTRLTSTDNISKEEMKEGSGTTHLDVLSERLQRMGIDISEMPLREFPNLAQALSDPKSDIGRPFLNVTVKTNTSEGDDGQTRVFQNVYANGPVSVEDAKAAGAELKSK